MKKTFLFAFVIVLGYAAIAYFLPDDPPADFSAAKKSVILEDNGFVFATETGATTVGQFLEEKKIAVSEYDQLIPDAHTPVFSGLNIRIDRSARVTIISDGKERELRTLAKTVSGAIFESRINLGEDDLINPGLESLVKENLSIEITRVEIREEIAKKPVDFKTETEEDDRLGWRIKKVRQKGVPGEKEIKYKIVSHDGKEISRKILEQKTTLEPVKEIVTRGTYVKLGKKHEGQGTWYAFKGGLFAANPWLPMGSYVKVTNKENGKSVIVQINDRGPFGPGRIIDLDKIAFQKIASLGAGVIEVKMEEILN